MLRRPVTTCPSTHSLVLGDSTSGLETFSSARPGPVISIASMLVLNPDTFSLSELSEEELGMELVDERLGDLFPGVVTRGFSPEVFLDVSPEVRVELSVEMSLDDGSLSSSDSDVS